MRVESRIPGQQVERHRLAALQVIVHDIGPDQVVRPQHVEGGGHRRAIEIAGRGHFLLERLDAVLVDEDLQVAGLGEIDLGGKESGAGDAIVVLGRHIGEGVANSVPPTQ